MLERSYYWHIHHDTLLERVVEPIETRKAYIRYRKLPSEIKLRLKLLRKARIPKTIQEDIYAEENLPKIMELHAKQCNPKCPWRFRNPENPDLAWGSIFWDENYDADKSIFTLSEE